MRIYIAARYDRRFEMLGVAAAPDARRPRRDVAGGSKAAVAAIRELVAALEDVGDLAHADCLVTFTEQPERGVAWAARGGRHVEFGIALACGKRLCVVGPRENVFHHLPSVEVYATVADLIVGLGGPPMVAS